jgi:predicted transcriptional regulator
MKPVRKNILCCFRLLPAQFHLHDVTENEKLPTFRVEKFVKIKFSNYKIDYKSS